MNHMESGGVAFGPSGSQQHLELPIHAYQRPRCALDRKVGDFYSVDTSSYPDSSISSVQVPQFMTLDADALHLLLPMETEDDRQSELGKDVNQDSSESSSCDSTDKEKKLVAVNKELQQLAFINPGRLTVTAGFNPEFSNREKRKLSRLMEQQGGKGELGKNISKLKHRRQVLHDSNGCLVADGRDLCDCQDPNCPGCHYPCLQCKSEKCGSSCRCDRRWSYDHVDVYHEGTVMSCGIIFVH